MIHSVRYPNSHIINNEPYGDNIIKYSCECSKAFHLTELYFCTGCQNLNCRNCVNEDIDCYFCPNCLDIVSLAEASLYGNRCKKCYDCPVCFGALNYQQQQQSNGTEVFFLNCAYCKWNTQDSQAKVDIQIGRVTRETTPQQIEAERVLNALQKEVSDANAHKDRSVNRLRMAVKQFLNPQLTQQTNAGSSNIQSNASREERWSSNRSVAEPLPHNPLLPQVSSGSTTSGNHQLLSKTAIKKRINPITTNDTEMMMQQRVDSRVFKEVNVDDNGEHSHDDDDDTLPASLLEMKDSSNASSIDQRLASINTQSSLLSKLAPQHRQLMSRRSKRCKRCDKLLAKFNPSKTEFKRQHFAFTFVPGISIARAVWVANDVFEVYITFTNPLHSFIFMAFPQSYDSSVISIDDNSRVVNVIRETYLIGLLDETDDKMSGVLDHINKQQQEQEQQRRSFIERKDNKLTLRIMVKVGLPNIIKNNSNDDKEENVNQDDNTNKVQEITEIIEKITITDTSNMNKADLPKYETTFESLKFTLFCEFSTNCSLVLSDYKSSDNNSQQPPATPPKQIISSNIPPTTPGSSAPTKAAPLKILFDIPSRLFDNTLISDTTSTTTSSVSAAVESSATITVVSTEN